MTFFPHRFHFFFVASPIPQAEQGNGSSMGGGGSTPAPGDGGVDPPTRPSHPCPPSPHPDCIRYSPMLGVGCPRWQAWLPQTTTATTAGPGTSQPGRRSAPTRNWTARRSAPRVSAHFVDPSSQGEAAPSYGDRGHGAKGTPQHATNLIELLKREGRRKGTPAMCAQRCGQGIH